MDLGPVAWLLAARNNNYYGPRYDDSSVWKVLIPVSVFGWLVFGIMCILCINGRGRAGRWVPKWYADTAGTAWDRTAVAAWWTAVVLTWPAMLPGLGLAKLADGVRAWARARRRRRRGRGEKTTTTTTTTMCDGDARAGAGTGGAS